MYCSSCAELQHELKQVRETLLTIQEAMLTPEEFRELAQWAPYPSLQEKTKKLAAALEGPRK